MPVFLEIPGFGLCNRLRTILAFWEIAHRKNTHLYVYWHVNHLCQADFDELFEPLPNTTFIKKHSDFRHKMKHTSHVTYFKGQGQLHKILPKYGVRYSKEIGKRLHKLLCPVPDISEKIQRFIEENELRNCIGLHIRRTDHVWFMKNSHGTYTTDDHFEKIIKKHPNSKFFLSTDNLKTQNKFIQKFPNRIIIYETIPDTKSARKTSVEHAVIDLFLLASCKTMYGSLGSSFSETSKLL